MTEKLCRACGEMVSETLWSTHISALCPKLAELDDDGIDSGMSGEAAERAEWLWANLPTGNRTWEGLATHEKALVCHTLARFEALARSDQK